MTAHVFSHVGHPAAVPRRSVVCNQRRGRARGGKGAQLLPQHGGAGPRLLSRHPANPHCERTLALIVHSVFSWPVFIQWGRGSSSDIQQIHTVSMPSSGRFARAMPTLWGLLLSGGRQPQCRPAMDMCALAEKAL